MVNKGGITDKEGKLLKKREKSYKTAKINGSRGKSDLKRRKRGKKGKNNGKEKEGK